MSGAAGGADPARGLAGGRRRSTWIVLALVAACGVILLERLHTFAEPFDRDVATYAVIAREMRHGRDLYTDLWDNKPPLLYGVYGLAQVLAGDGPGSVFLIGVTCALVTAAALYHAGTGGGDGSPGTGVAAAAFWTLVSADLPLEANQPNIEALLNASFAVAFAALLRAGPRVLTKPIVSAGAALAAATLFKPVAAPVVLALALAHVLLPPGETPRRRAIAQAALVLGLVAAACLAVAAYYLVVGRWAAFWQTIWLHNRHYSGSPLANVREGLRPGRLFSPVLRHALPLAVAAAPGALLALTRRPSRPGLLLGAWLLAVPVVVSAPGKFYPHYYQLWLPPLCLAAAWSLASVARRTRRPVAVAGVAAATTLAVRGLEQRAAFALDADGWSSAKYGDVFLRSRDVARDVESMIGPQETFFQWGNEPELYLYTRRPPPTGVLWAQYMQYGPLRISLRTRALQQLSVMDPELIVFSRDQPPPTGALGRWFQERYAPHPLTHRRAGFSFWVRRGGRLERRLASD
jgi:hypothetical protein